MQLPTVDDCHRCELSEKNNPISGKGPIYSSLLIIDEHPGYDENLLKEGFTGLTSEYLRKLLREVRIDEELVYFTYLVKCKCSKASAVNIKACNNWLLEEIECVSPKVIVTLGQKVFSAYNFRHFYSFLDGN